MIAFAIALAALFAAAPASAKDPVPAKFVTGTPVSIAGQFAAGSAKVTCPKGTQAVAGGFTTSLPVMPPAAGAQWIDLYESQRTGQRAWRVSGVQSFAGTGTLSATAYCEPLKAKVRARSQSLALGAAGATVTGLARCPKGTKVLSGGFAVPPASAASSTYISRSIAGNGLGWVVDATRLTGADAATLTTLAYCADVGKLKTGSASVSVLGSSGASQTAATPACPKKTPLRGGGFATSTPVNGLLGSALVYESRPSGQSWLSTAVPSGTATSSTLVTNAYCR